MIRDILGKATKGTVNWVGKTLGIPTGVTKVVTDVTGIVKSKDFSILPLVYSVLIVVASVYKVSGNILYK